MPSFTSPFKRVARLVKEHIRRLRDSLAVLAKQVRAAIARVVGQTTGDAVRDALTVVLDGPPAASLPSSRDPPDDRGFWHEGRRPYWSSQQEYDPYDERDRYEEDYDDVPAEPAPKQPRSSMWARVVAVGCQAASWFLRRHPGRNCVIFAVGVGIAAGVAAIVGSPLVSGTSAVVVSALGVLSLVDAACFAATFTSVAMT
jgi:hypothetical protein